MNTNFLALTGFKLKISSPDFEHVEYFATSASFPSISLPETTTSYRNCAGFVAGDKITYDPLTVRVAVDEQLNSYREIFNWLSSNVESPIKYHDITLSFITNHNNTSRVVRFVNAFPTNMGGLEFNVQSTETEYASMDVTFRYDYFEFVD
jgi:hypothetical protein